MDPIQKHKFPCRRIFGIFLIGVTALVMGWQLYLIYTDGMRHVLHGLLFALAVCVPLVTGVFLLSGSLDKDAHRRRAVRAALHVLFAFYCAALFGALIVSRVDYVSFAQTRAEYWKKFDLMTNFIPLETVRLYLNAIKYNYIGMEIPLSNLVGNAMLFMPLSVFLPCLFRPMQKFWLFALTVTLVFVAVEALQLALACGSCDVDDVLLNLVGAMIVFGLLKIPVIQRLMKRLCLLPEEPNKAEATVPAEEAPAPIDESGASQSR